MTESTAIIDTPLSAGEVAEVVSKSRNRLFRSAAAICAGEIRGKKEGPEGPSFPEG